MSLISRKPMPAQRMSVNNTWYKIVNCACLADWPSYVNSMLFVATVVRADLRATWLSSPLKIWRWSSSARGSSSFGGRCWNRRHTTRCATAIAVCRLCLLRYAPSPMGPLGRAATCIANSFPRAARCFGRGGAARRRSWGALGRARGRCREGRCPPLLPLAPSPACSFGT